LQVKEIRPDAVTVAVGAERVELPNDGVFVFAGGEPPYAFLRSAGVSFGDAEAAPAPSSSPGTSRVPALART
jgi:thioredoxin reductase